MEIGRFSVTRLRVTGGRDHKERQEEEVEGRRKEEKEDKRTGGLH